MKCIVSGGTGFIGRRIVRQLLDDRHQVAVWTRRTGGWQPTAVRSFAWDPLEGEPTAESLEGVDAVIHLAGEPVAQRWNAEVKTRIRDSRILGTRRLVEAMAKSAKRPRVLVSASAIGYYGDRGDSLLTEDSGPGTGFLVEVCRGWEEEAGRAEELGVRVVRLRIGFVLGKNGGALKQMVPAFRAFVGGRLGSGKQWMPWIHERDVSGLFAYAVANEISGVWNATSPNPVTNAVFTGEMGKALHRPTLFPVPPFALKLAFGELAQHMLDSARVIPAAAMSANYPFRFPDLAPALKDLMGS